MNKPSLFVGYVAGCLGFPLFAWFAPGFNLVTAGDPAFVVAARAIPERPSEEEGEESQEPRVRAVDRGKSGKLLLVEADGQTVRTLVDSSTGGAPGTPVDVMSPSVSYDAQRIVFSGFSEPEDAWRIYEVQADGTALRQITRSDRRIDLSRYGEAATRMMGYDDVDPCYLPDGRICFSSTRYPGIAPDDRLRATNLYVVNADGTDLHRITTERFGADSPAVEPSTGRIVFSRWWRTAQSEEAARGESEESVPDPVPPGSPGYGKFHGPTGGPTDSPTSPDVLRGVAMNEFPGVNSWFLSAIAPDGTGLVMYSGFRLDRELTQAYRPSFRPSGAVLALFIPQTPFLGSAGQNGLRLYEEGPGRPGRLGGPQSFGDHTDAERRSRVKLVYASAAAMNDGRTLVTASEDRKKYDVYIQPLPSAYFSLEDSSLLDAVPLEPRPLPPVLEDQSHTRMRDEAPRTVEEARTQGGTFQFECVNIHFNAGLDVPIVNAPPVGKGLAIEFYTSPQRTGVSPADPPLLVDRVEIGPDGRIEVELPAGVPLFEVLRRPDGSVPLGRDGQIFHVGGLNYGTEGHASSCVGCHAGHSMMAVPDDPLWTNLAPSAVVHELFHADPARNRAFAPQAIVDRRTSSGSEWVSKNTEDREHRVQLRWTVPIQAREAIVYAPQPQLRRQEIRAFRIATSLGEEPVEEHSVTRTLSPEGTRVYLDPDVAFDAMVLTINNDAVEIPRGRSGPAVAEIEVIARVADGPAQPTISFVRGDANCDAKLNHSDALTILDGLFKGEDFCCAPASDVDADGRLTLSDAIFVLLRLFQQGELLPEPFPDCGRAPQGDYTCDKETCP